VIRHARLKRDPDARRHDQQRDQREYKPSWYSSSLVCRYDHRVLFHQINLAK
jgi:hypothetical protein